MGLLRPLRRARIAAVALAGGLLAGGAPAQDAGLPSGEDVARRINARDEGESLFRRVTMELVDEGGQRRVRETRFYRRTFGGEKRMAIFHDAPTTVKGTALLTVDHPEADREDDQWLYLPALRRVRRIAASDRGESFLGTDLSYEDVKKETKVGLEDYTWRTLGEAEVEGHRCLQVEAVPVDERRAAELGYGRVVSWVDAEIWMVRRADYYDRAGRPLKRARVSEIRAVDGFWTPHRIEVQSQRSGHRTIFTISDVSYAAAVPEEVFSESALRRGGP
jgi:outer membrane lipoprotein-sorting protein